MSHCWKAGICALLTAFAAGSLPANEATTAAATTRRAMGTSGNSHRVDPLYAMRGRPEGTGPREVMRTVSRSIPVTSSKSSSSGNSVSTASNPSDWRNSPRYAASAAFRAATMTPPPSSTPSHPWKEKIVTTIFWVGEKPSGRNKTPNHKSSWDGEWMKNFGGYDDPNPANRTKDYRPKTFSPKLNPFYVALPYNDVLKWNQTKREAAHVIPWYKEKFKRHGRTVCKGRWIAIRYGDKTCYAQWEDCGPFTTDDWNYVFGKSRPSNSHNNGAGLDVAPAVRDYLGIKSGAKCDWRFCDDNEVPQGPWLKYGADKNSAAGTGATVSNAELERLKAQRAAWLRNQYIP